MKDARPATRKSSGGERSSGRDRRSAARARMYHDLVFETAESVFAEHGFDAATMQEIAGGAGVSLQTLYSVTSGKRELYDEIRATRAEALRAELAHVIERQESTEAPFELLASGVRIFVAYLCDHPAVLRIQIQEARSWPVIAARTKSPVVDGIEALVRRGIELGAFQAGDPRTLTLLGFAIVQTYLARMLDVADADEAARSGVAEEIIDQLHRAWSERPDRAENPSSAV